MTSNFEWTPQKEKAAELLAQGNLKDGEIAEEIGIHRGNLYRWQQEPEFAARIEEILDRYRAQVRRRGLALRERRLDALNDRWHRMQEVIRQRSESQEMAAVAGGETGLMVHNVKGVGKGDDFQLVDLYEVDTALLREIRETEKQAAQELGQWSEKVVTEQTVKAWVGVTPDDL